MIMPDFTIGDRVYVKYPDQPSGSHGYVVPFDPEVAAPHRKYKAAEHVMVDFRPGVEVLKYSSQVATPREYVTLSPDLCPEQVACGLCKDERAASPGRLGTDDEITRARDILVDGMEWSSDGLETTLLDLFERVVRACRRSPVEITLAEALETTEGEPLAEVRTWWAGM